MRYISVAVVFIALVLSIGPAAADGCYIPPLSLDAKSHSRNIAEPSQKAIICHLGGREQLVIQVSYKGDVDEFCWLVPTPAKPEVSIVETPMFHALYEATAPELRYWLDADRQLSNGLGVAAHRGGKPAKLLQVDVIERKRIGSYDVSVLRAGNAADLTAWLTTHGYRVTSRYTHIFEDYLKRGWVFTAAKIVTSHGAAVSAKLKEGVLAPLRLDFDSPKPIYPLKISSLNPGATKLLLYTISEHRLECAGFKTDCVMDITRPPFERFGHTWDAKVCIIDLVNDRWRRPLILTKLYADLSPERMTQDIVFTPAKTDDPLDPPYASPGFIENLGAASMLILATPLVPPFNVVTCFVVLVASAFSRTRRIRIWHYYVAAAVFCAGWPVVMMTVEMADRPIYRFVGMGVLAAMIAALAVALVLVKRVRMRSAKRSAGSKVSLS